MVGDKAASTIPPESGPAPPPRWVWWWWRAVLLVCMVLLLQQCFPFWTFSVAGQVVDGATGKPVAGAYVVAKWNVKVSRVGPHWSETTRCVRNQTTVTNDEGRFRLLPALSEPAFGTGGVERHVEVSVYKPGMIVDPGYFKNTLPTNRPPTYSLKYLHQANRQNGSYVLVRDNFDSVKPYFAYKYPWDTGAGTVEEEFTSRLNVSGNVTHAARLNYLARIILTADCITTNDFPFMRAVYEEGRSLAQTEEEWKAVTNLCIGRSFDRTSDPMCRLDHPAWTGASRWHREVFEQIEKDFDVKLEGMPR